MHTPIRATRSIRSLDAPSREAGRLANCLGKSPQRALDFPIAAALALLFTITHQTSALAGDILRGGRSAGQPAGGVAGNAAPTSDPAAAAAAANARDALARTSKAIAAVRAMEDSARVRAQSAANLNYLGRALPAVPNGLQTGGLKVAPGVPKDLSHPLAGENASLWQGAKLPRLKVPGNNEVEIVQTDPRAVLNWETFNVGKDTKVDFNQSAGGNKSSQWIAFNKIDDPSGVPSQILGTIVAQGQVYLMNRNGIVFGGTSSVNVHTLAASSLNINDDLVKSGLLNNPKAAFLFSAPTATDPAFTIGASKTYTLADTALPGTEPTLSSVVSPNGTLVSGTDYQVATDAAGKTTLKFTDAGIAKAGGAQVTASYFRGTGNVEVQAGASLKSPTSASHVGGRIALFGSNVINDGRISTPDGQLIMAAGLQVGLAAHAASDPSLRGLDVFVGKEGRLTGAATNSGLITAQRASVTIAGKTVSQLGGIDSTTSVSLNGRIDLLANYDAVSDSAYDPVHNAGLAPFFFRQCGTVILGGNSATRILPEVGSSETLASTKLPLQSQANLQGQTIYLAGNSTLLAPNAAVSLQAGQWDSRPTPGAASIFVFASDAKIKPQIYLDGGAMINVAGSVDVPVPVGQNILSVEVRGAQVADSPLQRDGVVRGTTLLVDLRIHGPFDPTIDDYAWVGSPLVDARGYRDLVQRSVGELTAPGGSVSITSGGPVVLRDGSSIDASGGYIRYEGGLVQTTRLLSQGQLIDISQATPDRVYDGFYTGTFTQTNAKFGITETFSNPLALTGAHFENTYLSGAAGGSIAITAPAMALDGELLGLTVDGPRQRTDGAAPSSLSLKFQAQDFDPAHFTYSPTPPLVVIQKHEPLPPPAEFTLDESGNGPALPAIRLSTLFLSPDVVGSEGFGNLTIDNSDGDILIPANVSLAARAGSGTGKSSITLSAANLTIAGKVSAPGGTLSFTVYDTTPFRDHLFPPSLPFIPDPQADLSRGKFVLTPSGSLDTAGLIVDDRITAKDSGKLPIAISGGSVTVASYSAQLDPGSTIDVSGGVAYSFTGQRTFGNAGQITIRAGQDPNPKFASLTGGKLVLHSRLLGFSGAAGGDLTILAPMVQIGGTAPMTKLAEVDGVMTPMLDFNGALVDPDAFLLLPTEFFSEGGFKSYSIAGIGFAADGVDQFLPAVSIAPGTDLEPRSQTLVALPFAGKEGAPVLVPTWLPQPQRTPVSLSFTAKGITQGSTVLERGDFVMGAGAVIRTDPFSDTSRGVTISAQTADIQGSIYAPGGAISISGSGNPTSLFTIAGATRAVTTVHLSRDTVLSTAGATSIFLDGRGLRTGAVYNGGSITVAGNLLAERGAVLDASGTTGTLDLPPAYSTLLTPTPIPGTINPLFGSMMGQPAVPTQISSSGGSITLKGGQMLFSDATLRAAAGGPGALGGSLTVSSNRFPDPVIPQTPLDVTLTVKQDGPVIPTTYRAFAGSTIGRGVTKLSGTASGGGFVAVDSFAGGGFDVVNLNGTVAFQGPVSISAGRELRVGDAGVIFADSTTRLTAPYVSLGMPLQLPQTLALQAVFQSVFVSSGPFFFGPTYGRGHLIVDADLIDVGNLSLQGIGRADLTATGVGIRGSGTLNIAGALNLRATEVYPTTASSFTIAAYDKNVVVKSSSVGSTTVTLASAVLPPGFMVGSPLLGSSVVKIEGTQVTLAADANATIASNTPVVFAPHSGSVTVTQAGSPTAPLSAGGTLSIYAANITQGGTLLVPGGTINLGWDGSGASPKDYITGAGLSGNGQLQIGTVPIAQQVTLRGGSITSVALLDPVTELPLLVPFGLNVNGAQWIDPSGTDITAGGVTGKAIRIAGVSVSQQTGSIVDIQGGGDLYAYRFVPGVGGTKDILDVTSNAASGIQRFAIVPNYQGNFAPYAPFAAGADNLSGDPGYVDGSLRLGDKITLQGGDGFAGGTYTLLPARYALLPDAFLVTPQTGAPLGNLSMPDGSLVVSGFRTGQTTLHRFEIASSKVAHDRAMYEDSFANKFLAEGAIKNKSPVPRLPDDAGYLLLEARNALTLEGTVHAQAPGRFHGGLIDISTLGADILVAGPGGGGNFNGIVLNSSNLSSFGAESLLIGGVRTFGPNATTVTVTTNNLTVDNAGAPLTGTDIVLVANQKLTLATGSVVMQTGGITGNVGTLFLGDAAHPGSGDGVLLRVSSDPHAAIVRSGLGTSTLPTLSIEAGATVSGTSLILDSTYSTKLDPNAVLHGQYITLNSGQISIQLDPNVAVPANPGLVLEGSNLADLQSAKSLSLLSYGFLDIYGSGAFTTQSSLALHAAEIRGFGLGGGTAQFNAASISLDNPNKPPAALVPGAPLDGTLEFNGKTFRLGSGQLAIDTFQDVHVNAPDGFLIQGSGSLQTPGNFTAATSLVTAAKGSTYSIAATGDLAFQAATSKSPSKAGGLGATLKLQGARVDLGSAFDLRSGSLTAQATGTAATDDVTVSGALNLSGVNQMFFDLTRFTSGGNLSLLSNAGNVVVTSTGSLNVSAPADGGNAGSISVTVPKGSFNLDGKILGKAGTGGRAGAFGLDVGELADPGTLIASVEKGGFTDQLLFRVRTGDVLINSTVKASTFNLSLDGGSITVGGQGVIDASGVTGGEINLVAAGSVILQSGSLLTAEADQFSSAGKGGAISLEAGSSVLKGGVYASDPTAMVDLEAGSTLRLGVKSTYDSAGNIDPTKIATAAALGQFTGTLHLRAPQTAGGTGVQMNPVLADIQGMPSRILVEGYRVYQPAGGNIDAGLQGQVAADAAVFGNASPAIASQLFGTASAAVQQAVVVTPGVEIVNLTGDLTLTQDWDLATFRFGPKNAPGILTMRAAGDLVFNGALTDGFDINGGLIPFQFLAPLMANNGLLPANAQTWSYRLSAGSDLSAADFHRVNPLDTLSSGSLKLGKPFTTLLPDPDNSTLLTLIEQDAFQVIRTGSGDIDISVGRDLQLLNPFAAIYTAGTQVANPTKVITAGDFDLPNPDSSLDGSPAPQYSLGGGNVTIAAQQDIRHMTPDGRPDSERQLPTSWLSRRSLVDANGNFATSPYGEIASTTWWVNFGRFYEGVGTLGGGNATVTAGRKVENVDVVVATNARMAARDASGAIRPDAANLVELGGGDLTVRAGTDINGGVYYVERGKGLLEAGNTIHTNATRAPAATVITGAPVSAPETSWLPTTLFLGKGSFDVSAHGDILIGPIANTFLTPQGVSNDLNYRTYFSTYAPESSVNIFSLGGSITFRENTTTGLTSQPILANWIGNVEALPNGGQPTPASYEPWIRVLETNIVQFNTALSILPGTLTATAFSGDINLAGNLTLAPAPRGSLDLVAAGAINGLQPIGRNPLFTLYDTSRIIVSDADPAAVPGVINPLSPVGSANTSVLLSLDAMFAESGSVLGAQSAIQTKLALHDSAILHEGDPNPIRLYATGGNLADLTLYTPKAARVFAQADLTDVGLYLQNVDVGDVSVVSAGGDLVAYNPNSPLLQQTLQAGRSTVQAAQLGNPAQSGDIQISGPGTLEVLAGGNLDLGAGRNPRLADDLGVGITSVGNVRNPALPFKGARIIVGAGIPGPADLSGGSLDFKSFIEQAATAALPMYLPELQLAHPELAGVQFTNLPPEQQATLALDIFFLILRDSGRTPVGTAPAAATAAAGSAATTPAAAQFVNGFAAIAALFPNLTKPGDISLSSRSIKTSSGGDINIIAPAGGLTLGFDIPTNDQAPPGIVTEFGGNISIFTNTSVQVGALRIFTLRGGNELIWSSTGDIAAGNASKTVQTAPPTRVVIDSQSADVQTDLAGLATGGGIGVLASVAGVMPGNVDLIAPAGVVDAGDAGIRATGNISIAATAVLNAGNIAAGGSTAGVPVAPSVAAPNLAGISAASNAGGANTQAAADTQRANEQPVPLEQPPSIVSVEVYVDSTIAPPESEEERRKRLQREQSAAHQ